MGTSTRKQREIQEREELILDVTSRMLVERGYNHLTMDRIAEAIEYSKGTVYQHFSCKEDLLATLALRNTECRAELFARAVSFDGTTRERMTAIGTAFDVLMNLHPDRCKAETIYHASHMREKASDSSVTELADADARCDGVVGGLIQEAIEKGELPLRDESTVHALYFGLWALSWGSYQIVETVEPCELSERGFEDPLASLHMNQERLLDGYGWKALSSEHDYDAVRQRVRETLFAEELRQIQAR
jgi:AcrR family transcriptional regulator